MIEYLDVYFPGKTSFIPKDPGQALETRLQDRFFDLYMNVPLQKVVTDRLRPAGMNDPHGVEQAQAPLQTSLKILDEKMESRTWAIGDAFTMADCAAAPALFYTNMIIPLAGAYKNTANYLDRLMQRPSYARTLKEAEPYLSMVPK